LNRLAKEMFGLQLELKENGFAKFENGYFYTQSYEFGGDTGGYSPQVTGLYALGGGYYYALLDIHVWGVYEHDFYNGNQAIETWTALEKSYISEIMTGYAILKKQSDGWNVVVSDNSGAVLTRKDFKQYEKLVKTATTPDAWAQK